MQRIAINGFGRIGRNVLRAWIERVWFEQGYALEDVQIVAINDIADAETLAHLLRFDSTHGRFPADVQVVYPDNSKPHADDKNHTAVAQFHIYKNHQKNPNSEPLIIDIYQQKNPEQLPWHSLNIDLALECTGFFRSRQDASRHLQAGAKRVIIGAAPFDSVDIAIVYGVNQQDLRPEHQIISSVSCTTQALVPLVKILDDAFAIESALMTEVHAVTTDQAVLDHAHRDLRRARSAGYNIIPTTSSALAALKQVLPHMQDRIDGYSIRVPTINVAMIDLSVIFNQSVTAEQINQVLNQAARQDYAEIMQVTDQPLVSSDFNHSPYSLIVDSLQTMSLGKHAKVLAWYDNEWGYANRLLDLSCCFNSIIVE
ncbi:MULTISPECIES: type I glyceraldehyde-3-phosphate dehydrogenase [unclassified Acinetobacter]|uniref:type I glyceraldehyde-3-phosphate dehydrogenase n=1 Tax=unclassified Acinetobacter TaxID=196816 RepID=UPI0035BB4CF2